jgi:hypothetical protein
VTVTEQTFEMANRAAVDDLEIVSDPQGLDEAEIRRRHRRLRADQRMARLSKLSVRGGTDAFADLPWDDPAMSISADDPRLRVPSFDPLASSDWYQGLSLEEQTRVGAWRWSTGLTRGWRFENIMQQSLLLRGLYLDDDPAQFRYSYHEIIEESQHTLMFREVVDRIGVPVARPPRWTEPATFFNRVLARACAPAFFILVLGGEEPVDRYQRRSIREGIEHPMLEKIVKVHVAEEARHVSFARVTLERDVAAFNWWGRQYLGIHAAFSLFVMVRLMLVPPAFMARGLGVPHRTLTDPFRTPDGRAFLADAVAKPRNLLRDLGVLRGPAKWLWRALGLGEP